MSTSREDWKIGLVWVNRNKNGIFKKGHRHMTLSARNNIREGRKGIKHSKECKESISKSLHEYYINHPRLRKRRIEFFKGKNNPFRNKHYSQETKRKLFKLHLGKKLSEETKQKLRRISIELWSNLEYRRKTLKAQKEYRKKINRGK